MNNNNDRQSKPSFIKLLFSALAAAFGVQSKRNLEDDFNQSSAIPFIIAGIVFTVLFILTLIWVVDIVLANAS